MGPEEPREVERDREQSVVESMLDRNDKARFRLGQSLQNLHERLGPVLRSMPLGDDKEQAEPSGPTTRDESSVVSQRLRETASGITAASDMIDYLIEHLEI